MPSPLWTQFKHTDDQGKTTYTDLTPTQLASVATQICEYLAYGKYNPILVPGSTLTTYEATNTVASAVGRLNTAATRAGTPITTTSITANTQVAAIARKLGTPQWA